MYLEDLVSSSTPSASQSAEGPDASQSSQSSVKSDSTKTVKAGTGTTATTGSNKRQRTLVDMLTPAPAGQTSKKLKLDKGGASSSTTNGATTTSVTSAVSSSSALNSIPFSLSAYQETLSERERELLSLECETMGKSWLKVLKDEVRKPYFIKLKEFLWNQGVKGATDSAASLKIYPAPKNIYSWSNLTPLGRVKVVIIGQDPYHGPGQAHGLCFSVPKGIAIPPSLRNIYAEIKAEYPDFEVPKHGNLTSWAENGVLLLNACLTVKASEAASHSNKGWEEFTDKVIDVVDKYGGANLSANGSALAGRGRGIVFLAWGAFAAKRVAKLDKKKHLILTSAHPSPLSANRGFFGNGHFKKANEWLETKYGADGRVDWCSLPVNHQ
ncbi:uracil-DNA glycosylase-like protein [Cristinia sonorae]|uniref:Uracil-DNA glycosylase n=1 Tax=Cristinia sonorae TaxID=1940300 RepID=A0A8K0XQ89_9AGAR|nr:uracil-DNA glycosylase-like protein [Cristinia sonorae]